MATKPKRVWTDLDAAFLAHPTTGDVTIRGDDRAIKFAVKALVMTQHYERLFHGEIGTPLKTLLFENFDDLTTILIKESILDILGNYEPRITVTDVVVKPDFDKHTINIDIIYKIKNSNALSNVSVTLDRSR